MVVHDLNVVSLVLDPAKDESPLVVNADTVESFPIAPEKFKTVSGRRTKIKKRMCGIQQIEFSHGRLENRRGIAPHSGRAPSVKYVARPAIRDPRMTQSRPKINGFTAPVQQDVPSNGFDAHLRAPLLTSRLQKRRLAPDSAGG